MSNFDRGALLKLSLTAIKNAVKKKVVVGKSCQNKVCSIFDADLPGMDFFQYFFLKVIFRPLKITV